MILHPSSTWVLCSLLVNTFWRVVFALCLHVVTSHLPFGPLLSGFCLYHSPEAHLPGSLIPSMLPKQRLLLRSALTGLLISIQHVHPHSSCGKESSSLLS